MKKTITILIATILLISCGSRKVATQKSTETKKENLEIVGERSAKEITKKTDKTFSVENLSSLKLSILPSQKEQVIYDKNQEDKICPKEVIYIKDKSGNVAEIPVLLDSQITFGSDELKTEKTQQLEQEIATKIIENNNLKSESEFYKKEFKKETEKKGLTFGDLLWIVPISMIFGVFIYLLVKMYVQK